MEVTEVEDDEHDSKERVLQRYFLQEWNLVKTLLHVIVSDQRVSDPSSVLRIRHIVDKYQEQGQLLEPYLESIVSPLMLIIRTRVISLGTDSNEIIEIIKPICIILYSLVTVCGHKAVTKFFPHQVSDLELAVSLLEKCHVANSGTSMRLESTGEMEAKCVMLLWLSILVLVPFDISSVDSSILISKHNDSDGPPPLVLRILEFSKDYLASAGPMRTISGFLLSRLLTRPDMVKVFCSFTEWTHGILSSFTEDAIAHFQLLGAVETLAAIFKSGSRKLLLDVAVLSWNDTSALMRSPVAARSPLLRKYLVKLSQRITLTCLPHRSPSWRYVGRHSTLRENIVQNVSKRADDAQSDIPSINLDLELHEGCIEEENMEVPDIVEEIIELLLSGLRDTDTVVRWSAAKGIGRVTSRLTYALSDEVLASVLELFTLGEGDGSWHGGCMALAELARRGLLLPVSFPKVVPVVVKALHYDIRRGPHSVGSHVRDAAAYVCWAFGRAYYHTDMLSIMKELAPHLLTVASYDREVNCRRAAAAAFQENVGRQGNFPHGIDIVNTADYFALSSRTNSYLHVAVSIAKYEGYLCPFVDELLHNKISHWDKGLRELAANALAALVNYEPEYFANYVLDKLVPCTLSSDLCMRHGATLSAGEVVLGLHKSSYALTSDKQKQLAGLVPAIEKARLYRGKGGEIMRYAVSRYIECISVAHIHLTEKVKRSLLDTLNENLRHPNSNIQNVAVEALKQFIPSYFVKTDDKAVDTVISKYLDLLRDPNVAARRGSALAIGVLPFDFLARGWKVVLPKLCNACAIEENPEERDAEARVNAVKGLISVCERLTEKGECSDSFSREDDCSLFLSIKNEVMPCLLGALEDYSVDNRGDVGSWVREAAMDALERCTYILCKRDFSCTSHDVESSSEHINSDMDESNQSHPVFDATLATSLISGISKQAVEKMDKLREIAARVLQRILYNKTIFVPFIPYREKLEKLVPDKACSDWGVPSFSYPRFVQLLELSCYSKAVLSGLIISIGGLQEFLKKASQTALLDYLEGSHTEPNNQISREHMLSVDLLWVLDKYKRCGRVIVPALKTIEIFFSKKVFLNMEAHTPVFCDGVLNSLSIELKLSKDFAKLYAGIAILGYIASLSYSVNGKAFSHLLAFLGHRYPKIRKASAEQVYLVLMQNECLVAEDKMEKALEIISETCWEGDIEEAKQQRQLLCDVAGFEFLKTNSQVSRNSEKISLGADENAYYSSLVGSAGF